MSIGNNKYYLFWRFAEWLNIYSNTVGFAWTLGTEWNIVCLLTNQADMKWAVTGHNRRNFWIIHTSSGNKNSYGEMRWARGKDFFQIFIRNDDHPVWLVQLSSSLNWNISLSHFKYQARKINRATTKRHLIIALLHN